MFVNYDVPRAQLDGAMAHAPEHLKPCIRAVRDEGCGLMLVLQGPDRFKVPKGRPAIVIIGDDFGQSLGPDRFHARSLRRAVERAGAAVVIASAPVPALYREAASWAVEKREGVVIVETLPRHEASWVDYIRGLNPGIAMALATVKPEGRA